MNRQFQLSPELQQFLQASGSRALTNVVWNTTFTTTAPLLPLSPAAVRRSITYTRFIEAGDGVLDDQYGCFISTLDGTTLDTVTDSRRL